MDGNTESEPIYYRGREKERERYQITFIHGKIK